MVVTTQEQKKALVKKSSYELLGAIGMLILGEVCLAFSKSSDISALATLAYVIMLASIIVWVRGCMDHSIARGYGKWPGLFGLFGLPGLIILALLPDKNKNLPNEMQQSESGYFRPGG